MSASIRKNLSFFIASNKNVRFCTSPVSLSLSRHFFSTQTPTHLDVQINPTFYDILVHKHHFPCDFASRVSSQFSHIKNLERVDSMLTFFKSSGFSNAQLQKILKYSTTLYSYSLEDKIKPKLKVFEDEGFSSGDISKIISSCPNILHLSLKNNIIPSLSRLKGLLGPDTALTVVRKYPRLLTSNLETTVMANVEFLKSISVSMDRIRIIFIGCTRAFCFQPQVIRASAEKAKEMGLTASAKAFIYAIPTIASMTNKSFELKFQAFRDVGFSDTEILCMFRKEPRVFAASTEKMKKITKGLIETGRFDISSIVELPISLAYSFEKRFVPRIRILRILESRSLIETWPTLQTLSQLTDAEFLMRFVSPYLDKLSDVDIPKLSVLDKVKIKP